MGIRGKAKRSRLGQSECYSPSNRFIFMKSKGPLDRREFLKTIAVGAGVAAAGMVAFAQALSVLKPSAPRKHFSPGARCSRAGTDYCKTCNKCVPSSPGLTPPRA